MEARRIAKSKFNADDLRMAIAIRVKELVETLLLDNDVLEHCR